MQREARARARDDVMDIAQVLTAVAKSYRVVLGVAFTVLFLVMAVTLAARMTFRSTGRLYLGELDDRPKSPGMSSTELDLSGAHGVVASEIEIIRSRALIERSVLESGLNVTITRPGEAPPRYWSWLLSRRDPQLVDPTPHELGAVNARFVDNTRRDKPLRIRFVTSSDYEVWSRGTLAGHGQLGRPAEAAGASFTLVAGAVRGPLPGAEYDVLVSSLEEVMDRAWSALQVTAPKGAVGNESVNVVTVEFTAASPLHAKSFLDRLMSAYIKERQSWKVEDATAAEAFVSAQLENMRGSLDRVQSKLADYRTHHQMTVLDNEAKALIEQIGKYEEQRVAARLQVAALSEIRRALDDADAPIGAYMFGEANDTVLDGMASALSKARDKLTELETRFSEAAPDVRTQRAQVDAQLASIRNYVTSRSVRAQGTLGTLSSIIGQFESKLKTVPGAELGLLQLSREADVYSRMYSYLLERQQQTAIIKASTLSKNRILDAPQAPIKEDSPKLALRAASGVLGLLLGCSWVLLRRLFAGSIQTMSEARRVIGDRAILATVPRRPSARRDGRGPRSSAIVDPLTDADSPFAEAFRTLRVHLCRAASGGEPRQVVLVTSPSEGDGKTTCALALGAVLAADGKKVLVIHADLRRPRGEPAAEQPLDWGLLDVLKGDCGWRAVVQTVEVAFGQVDVIASGGFGRPELLSGERMTALLAEARSSFDFIVIDAPSYPLYSDALALAPAADAVLSVLRLEHCSLDLAMAHVEGLAPFARHHDVIINDVGPKPAHEASRRGRFRPAELATPKQRAPMAMSERAARWMAMWRSNLRGALRWRV